MVDKQLRFVGWLTDLVIKAKTEAKYLESVRKSKSGMKFFVGKSIKGLDCREVQLSRTDGTSIRTRVYQPKVRGADLPAIVWLHGGGYAIGVPELDHAMLAQFMAASPCVVVAPDYRLSVDAPYPAALDDVYDTLLWTKNHAAELGIRTNQIMVGGNSAGGGLVAALTLLARDRGQVAVAFQMPLYPMIDDRMTTVSSQNNTAPVWDSNLNRWAWRLYLGTLADGEVPAYAAAARAGDYRNLPPTATFVGDLEPFHDETVAYVDNLRRAGVAVDFEVFAGCFHGFDAVAPFADVSKRAIAFLMKAYRYAVEHHFAEQPAPSA
jgi:acetyl esterase/lipase